MRYIYFLFIGLLTISCSETNMLQKSLLNLKASPAYLHDTRIASCNKPDSILILFHGNEMHALTKVSRVKGLILPFIFFNYFETNMKVELGKSSIQGNYNDFFFNSLMDESKRSGCFGIVDNSHSQSNYVLEISIDTCKTISKYQSTKMILFLVFAYSMSFNERGFPAQTELYATARLKKADAIISEKTYTIRKTQPFLPAQNLSIDNLREAFNTNMVEALSLSSKECIESIVKDVNSVIQKNNPLPNQ